jgi:hypothetical protein
VTLLAAVRSLPKRRLVPLIVLAVIALLYVRPVENYGRLDRQLSEQRSTLRSLEAQRARLQAEQAALGTRARMILLARECGWIFPGERSFVVKGTDDGEGSDCR